MTSLRVAVASWKLRPCSHDGQFFGHLFDLVDAAHSEGAQVLVLPELFCLELVQIEPQLKERDVAKYLIQYAQALEEWLARISASSGLMIVGGSHFKETSRGIVNVSPVAHPEFGVALAEKNNLTTYEQKMWQLAPGCGLTTLPDKRLGVTICYDSEFPESGRALAEAGVLLQCVPAFTETIRGFQRVRWCAQARAIENQIFVAHASLVGNIGREPVVDAYGTSAILCPSIEPFPANAVLAETPLNQEAVVVTDLHFDRLLEARESGEVHNWKDRENSSWTFRDVKLEPER